MAEQTIGHALPASPLSLWGLNLANFFIAEVVGVIIPFLGDLLRQNGWSYNKIGLAVTAAGMGVLIFQTPAGIISDHVRSRRLLLGIASILLGICYSLVPIISENTFLIISLLFLSGVCGAFFAPLLATLAISLVGRRNLDPVMGENQSWNHAGNIAAALSALAVVAIWGIKAVFFVMGAVSLLAAAALVLIRSDEINPDLSREKGLSVMKETGDKSADPGISYFLRNPTVVVLISCVALFHLANAPVMPMVALYLKSLGGGDEQVALVVLLAQAVMVPVALLAGKYCSAWGRKIVFSIAFVGLTIRILLYSATVEPHLILAIQLMDGIGAGIYGVVIALICSDLTRGRQGFNTLMGMAQTAQALGAAAGPLIQGEILEFFGFRPAFVFFAGIALTGAVLFIWKMPETKNIQ